MRVPVIVASEAYKFCEKVQLDSVVYNELGSASEIVSARNSSGGDASGEAKVVLSALLRIIA
jgi:translation initiation factor 2B subunit (eIF-2B alpha/beta/delta family)